MSKHQITSVDIQTCNLTGGLAWVSVRVRRGLKHRYYTTHGSRQHLAHCISRASQLSQAAILRKQEFGNG